jgi:hypothetical protein
MNWHYRVKAPDEKVRDPIQGEFFSTEAIKNPADALVREAVQNALDAALRGDDGQPKEMLRVRFFLATGKNALPAKLAAAWFEGSWEHFHASGNGLREAPQKNEPCPYLVFEDFTTTGLEGDIHQADPMERVRNSFFYFFRAEGRSGKSGEALGRWGVGKHVFPRSSRANAFFGLSVRANDGKRVLMGHSVFKGHHANGKYFCPDGYCGVKDKSGLVLPFTDATTLDKFAQDFRIQRTDESGLSVVVPWVDPEITLATLIDAAVRGYFYPILTGALSVTVETPEKTIVIDDSTLDEAALMLPDAESADILNLVELAEWASTCKPQDKVKLAPCDPDCPEWRDDLIPADQLKAVRTALEQGEKVAVRASLTVREKGKAPRPSHFDFYLRKDGFESGRPVFIREGLIVSDVRAPRARGIRSFVIAESGALATLLGDAENPAHTEWQSKGENFHGKYTYGPVVLNFVTRAVANFVHALTAQEDEEDKTLLLDIFSLPAENIEDEPKQPEKKKKKKGQESEDDDQEQQEPRKKRFRVQKAKGGFTITRGDAGTPPPARLSIRVAYDIRRGNPLRKYNTADFRLNHIPIKLEPPPDGLKVITKEENRIVVDILDPEFRLTVAGFDELRDLFVNVKMEEGAE